MAYLDKDKQREASKQAMRDLRAKNKVSALPSSKEGLENAPGLTKMAKVEAEGVNLPVNPADVNPDVIPKRGKDIKCFADLPPDVQDNINWRSESNEEKQKRTAAAIEYQHLFPNRYHSTGNPGYVGVGG